MKRNIIEIDRDKCNGCGLCVNACHEGALAMVDGKAQLISDSYCDGLGACLPECPTGAIQIIERDADAFDEELVKAKQQKEAAEAHGHGGKLGCGCPSAMAKKIERPAAAPQPTAAPAVAASAPALQSELSTWPVQIKLVPPTAPYLNGAHLLIAADCTAFAYANIHSEFMRGKVVLIGCPKLDEGDYSEKLTEIFKYNDIQSVTILRMEVPCCAGIVNAAKNALQQCGKMIPWGYRVISINGELLPQ